MDSHLSIMIRMSILATTIDRTLNLGLRSTGALTSSANNDMSIINPRQSVLDRFGRIHITS